MVARPDLPEEILIHIFSRLPAKSVGRFRTLSSTWRNLLSTPHFIKSHLALQNTRPKSLILISHISFSSPPTIRCVETIRCGYGDTVSQVLNLQGPCCEFLGSCDGLVLLRNKDAEVFLLNPITMEQSKIPDPPVPVAGYDEVLNGLGYDSVGDDYKVVALFYPMPDDETDPAPIYIDILVYVYYVKRGVWKKIESSPRHYGEPVYFSGIFLNGAIHWLVAKSEDCAVIAALDLDNEVFFEIPAPNITDLKKKIFGLLLVLEGCLCVVDTVRKREGIDVWIMKDYGVAESWRKLTVSVRCFDDFFLPLCFIGDGEDELMLLDLDEGRHLVVYNVKEGTMKDMVVDRVSGKFEDGGTFVGSLVSPA